jgi:outer membrane protein assembly factor BamE (lipoprotein component of BamABCDE complex)
MKPLRLSALALALALHVPASPAKDGTIDSTEDLQKIRPGITAAQVTEIAGKPIRIEKFPRKGSEYWTYTMQLGGRLAEIAVEFDDKGIVRGVERVQHWGP